MIELVQIVHVGGLFHEYHGLVAVDVVVGIGSDLRLSCFVVVQNGRVAALAGFSCH